MKSFLLATILLTSSAGCAQPVYVPRTGGDFTTAKQERLRQIDAARACAAKANNFDQLRSCQSTGFNHMQSSSGGCMW